MSKPLEVNLANITPTPFTVVPAEEGDGRGRVVLVLHRYRKPSVRVTFDRYQWVDVLEALTAAINGRPHPAHFLPSLAPLALTAAIG